MRIASTHSTTSAQTAMPLRLLRIHRLSPITRLLGIPPILLLRVPPICLLLWISPSASVLLGISLLLVMPRQLAEQPAQAFLAWNR